MDSIPPPGLRYGFAMVYDSIRLRMSSSTSFLTFHSLAGCAIKSPMRWFVVTLFGFLVPGGIMGYSPPARSRPTRTRRPAYVVVGRNRSGKQRTDLWAIGVRRKTRFRLTKDRSPKTALQCSPTGKRVVYVSKRKVYSVSLFGKKGKRGRVFLGELPKVLWKAYAGQLEHFVKLGPLGKYAALPTKKGVKIVALDTGKRSIFKGRFCAGSGGKAEGLLRLVHPVFWMPHGQKFVYLAIRGEGGCEGLQVGLYDVIAGRQTACLSLDLRRELKGRGVGSVDRFEAVWSNDGSAVALSIRVRPLGGLSKTGKAAKAVVAHRVVSFSPKKCVSPPPRVTPTRFHGWQYRSGTLLFTGRRGKRLKLYAWRKPLEKKKTKSLTSLAKDRRVFSYSPFLRTALLEYPGRKGCRKTRLVKLKRGRLHSLVRWAVWSEFLAMDASHQWGLFRCASRCRHRRPVLYLMRTDGSKLTRELPKRFRWLRTLPSSRVCLCSR